MDTRYCLFLCLYLVLAISGLTSLRFLGPEQKSPLEPLNLSEPNISVPGGVHGACATETRGGGRWPRVLPPGPAPLASAPVALCAGAQGAGAAAGALHKGPTAAARKGRSCWIVAKCRTPKTAINILELTQTR